MPYVLETFFYTEVSNRDYIMKIISLLKDKARLLTTLHLKDRGKEKYILYFGKIERDNRIITLIMENFLVIPITYMFHNLEHIEGFIVEKYRS